MLFVVHGEVLVENPRILEHEIDVLAKEISLGQYSLKVAFEGLMSVLPINEAVKLVSTVELE